VASLRGGVDEGPVVSGDIEVHAPSEADALDHARKARGLIEIKAKVLKKLK
jgi:hypothetical protein